MCFIRLTASTLLSQVHWLPLAPIFVITIITLFTITIITIFTITTILSITTITIITTPLILSYYHNECQVRWLAAKKGPDSKWAKVGFSYQYEYDESANGHHILWFARAAYDYDQYIFSGAANRHIWRTRQLLPLPPMSSDAQVSTMMMISWRYDAIMHKMPKYLIILR